jgi:hypothetical protein
VETRRLKEVLRRVEADGPLASQREVWERAAAELGVGWTTVYYHARRRKIEIKTRPAKKGRPRL